MDIRFEAVIAWYLLHVLHSFILRVRRKTEPPPVSWRRLRLKLKISYLLFSLRQERTMISTRVRVVVVVVVWLKPIMRKA